MIERWVEERGNAAMEYVCRMLSVAGVTFEVNVVAADAPLAITRIALARHCYFKMMGSRGAGVTAGMELGSVATKVVHLADLPVTLVK